jgi:hypothetical protein
MTFIRKPHHRGTLAAGYGIDLVANLIHSRARPVSLQLLARRLDSPAAIHGERSIQLGELD